MRRLNRFLFVAGLAATLLIVPAIGSAQVVGPDYRGPASKEWPLVGGDFGNTHYSALSQIDTSNVAQLKGAWMGRLNGSGMADKFSQQATPVVKDGVMYITTGQNDIFALDAKTGDTKWQYSADLAPTGPGRLIWANRGVAIGDGMVFSGQTDGNLVAVDQKTGKLVWSTDVGQAEVNHYGITMAPLYYDGLLFTGLGGSDSGLRGRMVALDGKTGKEVWRFYTVPGPGEYGNDTWAGDSWKTGGGAIWNVPTIDPDLGMIFFQVGNAWPDYDGSDRGGDNLFTASIVGLDYKTGKYRWHFQETHHDIWDYDASNAPILFNTTKDGQARKVIAEASKTGWVYLLDRTSGEPLVGVEERPVPQEPRLKTASTQPYPLGDSFVPQCPVDPLPGYLTGCVFAPFWDLPVLQAPGVLGGNDYAPISYSPQTDLVYVPGSIQNYAYTTKKETQDPVTGKRVNVSGAGAYLPLGTKLSGNITAIRPQTNTIAWQDPMPYRMGASTGLLTTGGGLLFVGQADGNFIAFDSQTGAELWRFQTGFGAEATPMSYEVDGVQYVAIATGGNRTNNSQRSDVVWSFALNGKLGPLPAPAKTGLKEQQFLNVAAVKGQLTSNTVTIGRVWSSADNKLDQESEYSYGPDNMSVPVGTTVTFTNGGQVAHTVTDQKANFDTDLIQPGDSASVTFNTPGSYIYFCVPHPWMIAQVVVSEGP